MIFLKARLFMYTLYYFSHFNSQLNDLNPLLKPFIHGNIQFEQKPVTCEIILAWTNNDSSVKRMLLSPFLCKILTNKLFNNYL